MRRLPEFILSFRATGIATVLAASAVIVIGWLDYLTPPALGLSLLYLVAISAAAWRFRSSVPAWCAAVTAAASWFLADIAWYPADHVAVSLWNTSTRLVIFAGAVGLISGLRRARERLRAALHAAEGALSLVVEQAPLGIIEWNVEFRVTKWNPAAERMFGYSHSEAVGRTAAELLIAASAREQVDGVWNALLRRKGGGRSVNQNRTKDGRLITCEWHNTPLVSDERVIGVASFVQDITEQVRSIDAMRDSEERFRTLYEAMGEGVVLHELVYDREGNAVDYRILDANRATEAMLGRTRTQLVGRLASEAYGTGSAPYLEMYAAVARKQTTTRFEVAFEPMKKTFHISAFPLGEHGFATVFEDLTEKRQLEEQFRQAQKMEAVGRLAGGVAHDFNNLLTGILGYCEFAMEALGEQHPSRGDLEQIQVAGNRAANLTRQLLAFSRKQALEPTVLSLNDVVESSRHLLRRILGEDIEIVARLASNLRLVKVDRGQMDQVLMNLAVNARDAMPNGGKLTLETGNVVLDHTYAGLHADVVPGPYVVLAVSDNGCGMTPDVQARLFEPFFTTKPMGKGTGLGLATVYGIVKQSGGNIWVYSEPGRGTTFKIYLPELHDAAELQPPPIPVAHASYGGETILLVEDHDDLRELASKALGRHGYVVLPAARAEEALELSARHTGPIALLVTDVVLPGMNGRALAEHLAPSRPNMRVLYMSGYTDDVIVHHGVLDPGTAYLQKPFTPAVLAQRVREMLGSEMAG